MSKNYKKNWNLLSVVTNNSTTYPQKTFDLTKFAYLNRHSESWPKFDVV